MSKAAKHDVNENENENETVKVPVAPAKKSTEYHTVKMDDDRVVDFAGKQKMKKEAFEHDGHVNLRLDFRNGETRIVKLRPDLLLKAAAHGLSQKFGDEIAGIDTVEDCVIAIDELHARMDKGEWVVKREPGTGNGASLLIRALAEVKGMEIDKVKSILATKTAAEKSALRESDKVAEVIRRLQKEKAKDKGIDSEALLDSF